MAIVLAPVQGSPDLLAGAEALGAEPVGILRKGAATMTGVYLHRGNRWCLLASAQPGGWITTACGDAIAYGPVLVCTSAPGELGCARCRAAAAPNDVENRDDDALGPNSAAIASALEDHEDLLDYDVSAFDHLNDVRDAELDRGSR